VRRAGFKTALKSVLRPLFAHPLHSERRRSAARHFSPLHYERRRYRISNAAIFSLPLHKNRRRHKITYAATCMEFILQSLYTYEQLEFLIFKDVSFKKYHAVFPVADARQLPIYRPISPSIHPYVNPSVSRSLHPSFHSSSIYLYSTSICLSSLSICPNLSHFSTSTCSSISKSICKFICLYKLVFSSVNSSVSPYLYKLHLFNLHQ
jgi:hypothetical protein